MFLWKTHIIPFSWSRYEATVSAYTTYSLSAGAHDPDIRTGEHRHLPHCEETKVSLLPDASSVLQASRPACPESWSYQLDMCDLKAVTNFYEPPFSIICKVRIKYLPDKLVVRIRQSSVWIALSRCTTSISSLHLALGLAPAQIGLFQSF